MLAHGCLASEDNSEVGENIASAKFARLGGTIGLIFERKIN